MLRVITPSIIVFGCLMHLFCCGIPLFLSVTSLAATFGISSMAAFEIEWFEKIEDKVLLVSGALLLLTFILNKASKKIDCNETGLCSHPPCNEKKSYSSYLIKIAVGLYALNLITVIAS